jgi:mannan endo-1,4-beta-mannosidase
MTRGRGSTYVSVVGGLSLVVVTLSLYLSPLGATNHHSKIEATARTKAGAADSHPQTGRPVDEHSPRAANVKAQVKSAGNRSISKEIVYVPTPGASSGRSSTATTTTPPSIGRPTTTTIAPAPVAPTFTVESKANLVAPSSDYWGVSINGVPQGMPQLRALDSEVGSAPSELTWYQGWDEPYPAQAVQNAWQNGALPMITWESKPTIDSTPAQSDPAYALRYIINGNYDSYLQSFAQSVVAQGMPVVIRLDQEMNGNWFPWTEGTNGNTSGQFVQMWQHVWNIFQAAGANQYVIWLWAPNRVDNLAHAPSLSELYPGDSYVDWVGIDAYWRSTTEAPTFAAVLGESIAAVNAVATKPIYIAETAGIETDPTNGSDVGPQKVQFTTNFLTGIEADTQIVGFSWFDNVATSSSDGTTITDDWRIDSDASNLIAFKTGLAAGPFRNGLTASSGPPTTLDVIPPSSS